MENYFHIKKEIFMQRQEVGSAGPSRLVFTKFNINFTVFKLVTIKSKPS